MGPTHKKLEPEAFGKRPGAIAPGVSGATNGQQATNGQGSGQGNGHQGGATPTAAAATDRAAGNGAPPARPQQTGTLPPAAFSPPEQRRPEVAQPAPQPQPHPHPQPAQQAAPPAPYSERTNPGMAAPAADYRTDPGADLDDDVDVPPFMKR